MSCLAHEQTQEILAAAVGSHPDKPQRTWLQDHLRECAACRDYERVAAGVVDALRSQRFAADSALVRTTLQLVRSRAFELRQRRDRNWLVSLSCSFVALSATIATPLFWKGFQRLGSWAGVSDWAWETGFTFFWMLPALVVSTLLLARGTTFVQNICTRSR